MRSKRPPPVAARTVQARGDQADCLANCFGPTLLREVVEEADETLTAEERTIVLSQGCDLDDLPTSFVGTDSEEGG